MTAEFFDLIHASDGWRCLFVLPDRKHWWTNGGSAALAKKAFELDAQGKAVFHGCATFKDPGSDTWVPNPKKPGKKKRNWDLDKREQVNVVALKCFWIDLDAGPGKPYSTARDAYRAFAAWRLAVGLPDAVVVASGGGLHLYWPLRDPLDLAVWGRASGQLRALAQSHGLAIDAGSTIDAARILRPPGTHNRKILDETGRKLADVGGPARPVKLGPLVGPYSREDLHVLFEGGEDVDQLANGLRGLREGIPALHRLPMQGAHDSGAAGDDGLTNIQSAEPDADPARIAAECAQVRRLRESGGQLPEPEWYSVLGVLSHCGESGELAAHQWSSGDPRYNLRDTDGKLKQARSAAGPTTCRRFADLSPAGCVGCSHQGRITSPIQLGRPLPLAVTAPAPVSEAGTLALPPLPQPYFWSGMRLALTVANPKEGAPPYHVVTEYPFFVTELQEAERGGDVSAVCRSWEPMKREWREFPMALKDAVGDRGAGVLATHGVAVGKVRWEYLRSFLVDMANHYRGSKKYGTRYDQCGWKIVDDQPAFVLGRLLTTLCGTQRAFGSPELERRAGLFEAKGSLAAWSAAVEKTTLRPGMEASTFQGLCGFASILYHLSGAEGGTIVHSTTLGSGKGKTFGLKIAGSVWGDWFGLRIKERDTEVAKFIAIGVLGHLPVLYDELRATGPDAAEKIKGFVLQYTLGEDKARGAPEGGLKDTALPWSNVMLSTANISLVDTCLSDSAETAQAARIFEFTPPDLPDDITTSYGDALEAEMAANGGHAGRAFVQACLGRWEWVKGAVPRAVQMWEQRLGGGPDARYTLRLLGAVSVAMAVVQQAGILKLDAQALTRWMDAVARENGLRIKVEREADPAGILSRMMNDLLPNTLVMGGPVPRGMAANARHEALREPRGELLARQEIEGRVYLVDTTAVKTWMQEHHVPMTELGRRLSEMGVVTHLRTRKTLSAGWRRLGGQPWCWQVDGNHPAIAELWEDVGQPAAVTESNVLEFPGGRA